MARGRGKKYSAVLEKIEKRPYALDEAIPFLKKNKISRFDETVEVHMHLGVNPKHADQMVRGTVVLPNGLGRSKKVLVIATPDMMKFVGRLGKILGPRGLMPNPKTGTVTMDVAQGVQEIKAGKIEFRVDKGGVIHAPVGKLGFGDDKLVENASVLIQAVVKAKPSSAKGHYVRSVSICSTMSPALDLNVAEML